MPRHETTAEELVAQANWIKAGDRVLDLLADLLEANKTHPGVGGDDTFRWSPTHVHIRMRQVTALRAEADALEVLLSMLFGCATPIAMSDQPVTCHKCGSRTEYEDKPDLMQWHTCLNPECAHRFTVFFPLNVSSLSATPEQLEREAIARFERGEPYEVSTGIHDGITYGYGALDDNGFWEFPLPPRYVK